MGKFVYTSDHNALLLHGVEIDVSIPPTDSQALAYDAETGKYVPTTFGGNEIGEANIGENVGTEGIGTYFGKQGIALQFKNINPISTNIEVTNNAEAKVEMNTLGSRQEYVK